jgi:hypothetical protein
MVFTILSLVLMGLTSGFLLLHWFALGFVSLVMSVVYLVLTKWDLSLLTQWAAVLAVLQLSHLAGAAIRVWWCHQGEERS